MADEARIDFYHLGVTRSEDMCALLAAKIRSSGERLLIVAQDADSRSQISEALWSAHPPHFLANGAADSEYAARQKILIAPDITHVNRPEMVILADGVWREGAGEFKRIFLLFDDRNIAAARQLWREFVQREGWGRNFWKQEEGRWIKAA